MMQTDLTPNQLAIDTIFQEQQKFIILGLTGRTGSGCTTAAELLSSSFDEFQPPLPKFPNFTDDEERKYSICHDFLRANWGKFHHIHIRNIITSFILDGTFEEFKEACIKLKSIHIENTGIYFTESIEAEFHALKNKLSEIPKRIADQEAATTAFDIHFAKIPAFTNKIKTILNSIEPNLYTKAFQFFGSNIRGSGNAYCEDFNPSNIYNLSQRANGIIKILRKKNPGERVFVCLDAIRNPFEALFFKLRYSAFYLLSITTNDTDRENRLRANSKLSNIDIDRIDKTENPKKPKNRDFFVSQNIQKCTQIADIHIYNPSDDGKYKELKTQLVKYLSLIMHPGLITPNKSERCMQIAYNAKLNSGCISRQVGAVVADDNYAIKSVGWNNTPVGQTPCSLRSVSDLIKNEDDPAFSSYEKKDVKFRGLLTSVYKGPLDKKGTRNGKPLCFCFKDFQNSIDGEKNQVHTRALHAEENAFLQISKSGGQGVKNGILFTTASPCELCSKKAYQLGIKTIYFIDPYPGIASDQILKSGKTPPNLILFTGAIGRAYQQLFEPVMAYKEELEFSEELKIPNIKSDLQRENESLKMEIAELRSKISETHRSE